MPANACRRCGTPLDAEGRCGACLLGTGIGAEGRTTAERLFQAALCLDASERMAFVGQAAADDPDLLDDVRMLLEGYAEAGGDEATPTLGHAASARAQWAARKGEEPGTVIDHFRLIRIVGEGGMGSVWEAEQTAPIQRRVALKVIKLGMDTREVVRRFERERSTLALMTHPCIARVFEAGATPLGRPYFAMELVEGDSITEHCRSAALGVRDRLALFLEVCAAVEHAHQKGVIHRDLKPSNILVSAGGVKVIDFGVAKATREDGGEALFTRQTQVLGTPAYMSPEQAESDGADVDTRSDVYSLGVVLYELLSGVLPFDPKRLASTGIREMQRILREEDPPRPSTRLTDAKGMAAEPVKHLELHGDLDWIVMRAMNKERSRRYRSAAALADDLGRFLDGEVVEAVPPTLTYRLGKFIRRNRLPVAAAAAVILALSLGLLASLSQARRAKAALAGEEKARAEATFTVADMYARSGFAASDHGGTTQAALWFANAAIIGGKDPDRAKANLLRATTWRQEAFTAVRAFDTGCEHLQDLRWNPGQPALIVLSASSRETQVWSVSNESRWQPALPMIRAAWSPDGEKIAVLLDGNPPVLVVLEYPSGTELARIDCGGVDGIQWSPDGRWIAAGSTLWDWKSGGSRSFPVPASRARFSADGKQVLLQSGELTGICALDRPEQFLHPASPSVAEHSSDFLAGGSSFMIARADGSIAIHDSATGELLETHANAGFPVASSPDGRYIARRDLPLLDRQGALRPAFPVHRGQFPVVRFSPDGTMVASGGYDDRLELWSLADGRFHGEVGHHHTGVVNLEFSPDGKLLASGEDGLVRVWRISKPGLIRKIPTGATSLAALSQDGMLIAPSGFTNYGGSLATTRAYDLATGTLVGPAIDPGGIIMDAVFGPESAWLAFAVSTTPDRNSDQMKSSGSRGNLQYWNPRTGEAIGDPVPLPSEPRGICLHPSENLTGVACAGGEGLEVGTLTRKTRLLFKNREPTHAGATLNNGRCRYSDDGRIFAAWGLFPSVRLWDREAGKDLVEPGEHDANSFDLDFHDGFAARAIVASSMRLEFQDLRTGRPAAPAIPYSNWPLLTRFHPEGNLLLSAGGGGVAQVWDWRLGKLVCPALSHGETIMAGTFLPGTPYVITGGHDARIRFWDYRTGMPVRPSILRPGWVLDLKLTPDRRTLVACGHLGGNIELIDLATLFPEPDLDPAGVLLLSEIDADAEVHPGGGLAPFTPQQWLSKWQDFRARHPGFSGHRLED